MSKAAVMLMVMPVVAPVVYVAATPVVAMALFGGSSAYSGGCNNSNVFCSANIGSDSGCIDGMVVAAPLAAATAISVSGVVPVLAAASAVLMEMVAAAVAVMAVVARRRRR